MYREMPPPPPLAGAVEAVWVRESAPVPAAAPHRILPDGCSDLIWVDGELLVAGAVTGPPGAGVAAIAAAVALSERQLRRRCLAAFGYGPRTLSRIWRFRRAVALARAGVPFGEVAVATGYADQPHLAREVRALAGVPLRELTC